MTSAAIPNATAFPVTAGSAVLLPSGNAVYVQEQWGPSCMCSYLFINDETGVRVSAGVSLHIEFLRRYGRPV